MLEKLNGAGYSAQLVGGCVRDMLLGRRVHDYDIATSALPEQVMAVFRRCIPTGIKHGTVTVMLGKNAVEVTTYRAESGYSDARRPDSVRFLTSLSADLSRRDFTINAMAMEPDGTITDPFGGRDDLGRRLIRCVGKAEERFREDSLRMLRALRFSAQLDFAIEKETMLAALRCAPLTATLAAERVRDELEKMLLSPRPELVQTAVSGGFLSAFGLGGEVRLGGLRRVEAALMPRFAALTALLGRNASLLRALRLDGKTVKAVEAGLNISALPQSEPALKRLCREHGTEAVRAAAAMQDALRGGANAARLRAMLSRGECFTAAALDIDGDELKALGFEGRAVGEALGALVEHVIDHPADNRREVLYKLVIAMRKTQ